MPKTLPSLMSKNEATRAAYENLMAALSGLRGLVVEEKKTCLHVTAGKAAFLGIHPRKAGLRLTLVLPKPLTGKRIVKCEPASKTSYHVELDLPGDEPIDDELNGWLEQAYKLRS